MKRKQEGKPSSSKKIKKQSRQHLTNLPPELITLIIDYFVVSDGISFLLTNKQAFFNQHHSHPLFLASQMVNQLQQANHSLSNNPYHTSLLTKATRFILDQLKAQQQFRLDLPKFKDTYRRIKKKHGKNMARQLKDKILDRVEYLSVNENDTRRKVRIGRLVLIHSTSFQVSTRGEDVDTPSVSYRCTIRDDENHEHHKLVKACSWFVDGQRTVRLKHLNRLLGLGEDMDREAVMECVLATAPFLSWSYHENYHSTLFTEEGAGPVIKEEVQSELY